MKFNYKKSIFKNFIWIINNIKSIDSKYIFISIFSTILNGSFPLFSVLIMQLIINGIQSKISLDIMILYIIIYLFINLLTYLLNNIVGYYSTNFSMKFNLFFSEKIYRKASNLSLSDYENSKTYDIMNRAQTQGIDKILAYYNTFMFISTKLITLISYFFILARLNKWIVVIIIIAPLIKYIVNNKINIERFNIIRERTNDSRKSWYITYLLSYGNFYKELKTYNLFGYFINEYKSLVNKFNKQDLNISKKQLISISIINIFETIIDGSIFYFIVYSGFIGNILIGDVITYIRSISNLKDNITTILLGVSNLISDSLFIGQLYEYFDMKEVSNGNKLKIDKISTIEIKNLNYKYRLSNEYALKNINLKLEKNKKVAIIGMNGSGKTTLIKLIMGFYPDYEGSILVNGIEVRDIDQESLLNEISVLFQDYVKYEATFRENIAYSNFNIINDDQEINRIVTEFNFTSIINQNENQLDTQLGTWFDNGINLSIGQWQKIALARALVKKGSIYILDEPNAAMDPITEREISKIYKNIIKNKMGIIIAHKFLNIINMVDEIVVLKEGKIIERGSHEFLFKYGNIYKKLRSELPDIAEQVSNTEKLAQDAERQVESIKMAEYMSERIGEKYTGRVSGITSFGIFVELENLIEGLVSYKSMDGYYEFDEMNYKAVDYETKIEYHIGDELQIEVASVDLNMGNIDFKIVGDNFE